MKKSTALLLGIGFLCSLTGGSLEAGKRRRGGRKPQTAQFRQDVKPNETKFTPDQITVIDSKINGRLERGVGVNQIVNQVRDYANTEWFTVHGTKITNNSPERKYIAQRVNALKEEYVNSKAQRLRQQAKAIETITTDFSSDDESGKSQEALDDQARFAQLDKELAERLRSHAELVAGDAQEQFGGFSGSQSPEEAKATMVASSKAEIDRLKREIEPIATRVQVAQIKELAQQTAHQAEQAVLEKAAQEQKAKKQALLDQAAQLEHEEKEKAAAELAKAHARAAEDAKIQQEKARKALKEKEAAEAEQARIERAAADAARTQQAREELVERAQKEAEIDKAANEFLAQEEQAVQEKKAAKKTARLAVLAPKPAAPAAAEKPVFWTRTKLAGVGVTLVSLVLSAIGLERSYRLAQQNADIPSVKDMSTLAHSPSNAILVRSASPKRVKDLPWATRMSLKFWRLMMPGKFGFKNVMIRRAAGMQRAAAA